MQLERQVIGIGADPHLTAALQKAIAAFPGWRLRLIENDDAIGRPGPPSSGTPVVVQLGTPDPEAVERFQGLLKSFPDNRFVAVVRDPGGETVRQLFLAGATDVLTGAATAEAVRAALEPLVQVGSRDGRIIAVVNGCGGAGATTLALNLGALLARGDPRAQRPSHSTAVLDLDLQFGDSDLALDLRPRTTLLDLLQAQGRVDQSFFEGVLTEHASGLRLLAPPPGIVPLEAMNAAFVGEVLGHAAGTFSRTLVDLPGGWSEWTFPVLARADVIIVVIRATVAGAMGARRVLNALRVGGIEQPRLMVLNQLPGVIETLERSSSISRSLEVPVDAALPFDVAAGKAADRGELVVEAYPKTALTKSLRALAGKVEARLAPAARKLSYLEAAE